MGHTGPPADCVEEERPAHTVWLVLEILFPLFAGDFPSSVSEGELYPGCDGEFFSKHQICLSFLVINLPVRLDLIK